MKSEFLDIQYFKILPKESIPENATRENIIAVADSIPEFPHIIGSPKFLSEEKKSDTGRYFVNQFVFSVISYSNEDFMNTLRNAGAVIIYTDLRILVIYANDVFSNTPLKFTTKSNQDVTDVELSHSTLFLL